MGRSISFSFAVVAFVVGLASLALDGCCGAGCPARTTHTESSSSSATHAALPPRMDLHCTPQSIDDESKCVSQGSDHHFGPPLECYGTPPPPDVEAAQREAWEKAASPCVCFTDRDAQMCSEVP
jgi:hypothetical protein